MVERQGTQPVGHPGVCYRPRAVTASIGLPVRRAAERTRGRSTIATLAETIRAKIDAEVLRCERPEKLLGSTGDGSPCAACDMPILREQVEWRLWFDGVLTHRFHVACYRLWEAECLRRGWRKASRA